MKVKVITVTIALTVATTSAYANGIQSPRGISQSAWNASSAYQNFQCPSGTARGEGVDMNYTTDRSDDFWFVECNPIITPPTITPPTITPVMPVVNDTQTATTIITTTPITTTQTDTNTVNTTSNTTTVSAVTTNADIYAQLTALFAKIFALLALLGVK